MAAGDVVLTASGTERAIAWLGVGRVLATPSRRNAATPVIVRKERWPTTFRTATCTSRKGHSLYIDDVLIPVEFWSIIERSSGRSFAGSGDLSRRIATHDILLADGAPPRAIATMAIAGCSRNANAGWSLPVFGAVRDGADWRSCGSTRFGNDCLSVPDRVRHWHHRRCGPCICW